MYFLSKIRDLPWHKMMPSSRVERQGYSVAETKGLTSFSILCATNLIHIFSKFCIIRVLPFVLSFKDELVLPLSALLAFCTWLFWHLIIIYTPKITEIHSFYRFSPFLNGTDQRFHWFHYCWARLLIAAVSIITCDFCSAVGFCTMNLFVFLFWRNFGKVKVD